MIRTVCIILVIIAMLFIACQNRLSPKTYRIAGEDRLLLSDKESYYLAEMSLSDEAGTNMMLPGFGNILVLERTITNKNKKEINTGLIAAVNEIEYRIYANLPEEIRIDSLSLKDQAVCLLMDKFEWPDKMRKYYCKEGYIAIDTVKSNRFTAFISGKFYNPNNDSLIFEGRFSAGLRK